MMTRFNLTFLTNSEPKSPKKLTTSIEWRIGLFPKVEKTRSLFATYTFVAEYSGPHLRTALQPPCIVIVGDTQPRMTADRVIAEVKHKTGINPPET